VKVCLFAVNDWANFGESLAHALRSVGIDANMYVCTPLHYRYAQQGIPTELSHMIQLAREADVVQVMHSGGIIASKHNKDLLSIFTEERALDRTRQCVSVLHGGSRYRQAAHALNIRFNSLVDVTIIQTHDLLNLGAFNEKWILAPVDANEICKCASRPLREIPTTGMLIVGHFPTSVTIKNSALIGCVMQRCQQKLGAGVFAYQHTPQLHEHDAYLKLVSGCDIYIDHQGYMQGDKIYGEFGISALEAAAMGKIVITCTNGLERYYKEYGEFVPLVSNSAQELEDILMRILTAPRNELCQIQQRTSEWVRKYHSMEFIGRKLKAVYEEVLNAKQAH
jgi:hypothetical protein